MKKRNVGKSALACASCGMLVAAFNSCAPDFVVVNPRPDLGANGYCDPVADGSGQRMRVTVKNQGTAAAAAPVRVYYPDHLPHPAGKIRSGITPTIEPGDTQSILIDLPSPPGGDYGFRIVLDEEEQVKESNENNNTAVGHCID